MPWGCSRWEHWKGEDVGVSHVKGVHVTDYAFVVSLKGVLQLIPKSVQYHLVPSDIVRYQLCPNLTLYRKL